MMDWPNDYGMPTEADEERKLKADLATERAGYDYLKAENSELHERLKIIAECRAKQADEIERLHVELTALLKIADAAKRWGEVECDEAVECEELRTALQEYAKTTKTALKPPKTQATDNP